MSGVISRTVLDSMEEVATVVPAAILLSCFCCWWLWEGLELGLNCAHVCSDFYQLRHHCIVEAGKDCILLFQSIHIVPLVINSLCDCLQWLDCFKMLFWWGGGQPYIHIYIALLRWNPLSWCCDLSLLLSVGLVEKYWMFPTLEVVWLSTPLSYIIVKSCGLCQKGNHFWHHHGVRNCLPSWSYKWRPLL